MMQIDVQRMGESTWRVIWMAAGLGAERDAVARYGVIRSMFSGAWDDEHNKHAGRWQSARLTRDGATVETCERIDAVANPWPSSWPPPAAYALAAGRR